MEKSDKELFRGFISGLNYYDYHRFRNEVIAQCGITRSTYYNWWRGTGDIRPVYKKIINEITSSMNKEKIF